MIKLRIILFLIAFIILGFFIYNGIAPNGNKTYCQDFSNENYFISKLSPKERVVGGIKKLDNILIGNPVYFSLRTLRRFDEARINLKYKDPDDMPLIELGVLTDNTIWRYNLKGIKNKLLEQLRYVWDVTEENNLILLQREKKYENIQDFLDNPPVGTKVATYDYDLDIEYLLSDYQKKGENEINSIIPALRGHYQFFTYIKDEKFDFEFQFLDLNQNKDKDSVDLHLYYNDSLIDSMHLDDDGIQNDNGSTTGSRIIDWEINDLPEGAYRVELRTNDDIVTESLRTAQNRLSFLNRVNIYREGKSEFSVFTDSKKIQTKTIYPGSLQNLIVKDQNMDIDKTYAQFEMTMPRTSSSSKYHEIFVEKDGIIITGDGVFSFGAGELINPRIKKADHNLDINNGEIDYILAKYNYVKKDEDISTVSMDFDLRNAYRHKYKYQLGDSGAYNFLISIPDLKLEDEKQVVIEEICIGLKGKTFKEKFLGIIKNN